MATDIPTSTLPKRPKIEYVIFDMDGLLIDSERIYTQVTNEILAPYGVEMTWDIKAGCMGKPEAAAVAHLLGAFPDLPLTAESYTKQRNERQDQLFPSVPLMPGAARLVKHLAQCGVPIAVATSTKRRSYALKTGRLGETFGCFEGRVICGDDEIDGEDGVRRRIRGKPDPDIFLTAARTQLARPVGHSRSSTESQVLDRAKGLVFEDAVPGVQAGKRAGMSVVWVADPNLLKVPYTVPEQPDLTLTTLEDFVPEDWGLPPYDKEAS